MNTPRIIRLHYIIRSFILLGFALYIAYLAKSGTLHYYIAPRMEPLIRYSSIPLVIMAVCLVLQTLFRKPSALCDCERPLSVSRIKNALVYGLFMFPLAIGVLLPDQALGSSAAVHKGMSLSSPLLSSEEMDDIFQAPDKYNTEFAELAKRLYTEETIEVKPEIFSEIFGAIELYKEQFRGKPVKLSGFAYEDATTGDSKEIILGRYLVLCCTADASPFGVLVTAREPIPDISNDAWLEVEGTIQTTERNGKVVITVMADQIRVVPSPPTPYVYPSADSVEQFDNDTTTKY